MIQIQEEFHLVEQDGTYYPRMLQPTIEAVVESEADKQARILKEIKDKRAKLAHEQKVALRAKDEVSGDYKLAKIATAASAVFVPFILMGWFVAVTWGVATNFSGGRGGVMSFYFITLIVCTVIDALCLVGSVGSAIDQRKRLTQANYRYHDTLEDSVKYETELEES